MPYVWIKAYCPFICLLTHLIINLSAYSLFIYLLDEHLLRGAFFNISSCNKNFEVFKVPKLLKFLSKYAKK